MAQRKKLFLVIVAAVMVLVVFGLVIIGAGVQAQESGSEWGAAAVTDSVEFSAEFQPTGVVAQYAWTSVNGRVVESEHSAEPQPMETGSFGLAGEACVFGGAGEGCEEPQSLASAQTLDGGMPDLNETFLALLGLGILSAQATVDDPFTTGARCYLDENADPHGVGEQPTGTVRYGSDALLSLQNGISQDISTVTADRPFSVRLPVGTLAGLLGALIGVYVDVEITTSSGWNPNTLRAHSDLMVRYRGAWALGDRDWITFTARSECGMLMSDGTGSMGPEGVSPQTLASPQALRLADPEAPETTGPQAQPTSAPGTPQTTGFTEESSLTADDGANYHLLSTRELDLLDHEHILEVLAATRETGAVEGEISGARWWLYSAEAAGEQVPVLEVELADAAVVQVRPNLPGLQHPVPDEVPSETQPSATPSITTEQLPEPTTQPPAEPTSESIPTTPEESGEDAEND